MIPYSIRINILVSLYMEKEETGQEKKILAYLQLVLSGSVIYWKLAAFLSQTEALTNMFRRDKIVCHLDA